MAQPVLDTAIASIGEENEVIWYLKEHEVVLSDEQSNNLIEMNLTLKDLSNMNINTDPSTFNELCKELKLNIGAKLKFRSAIIDLGNNKNNYSGSDNDGEFDDEKVNTKNIKKITIAIIGSVGVGKSSILTRFIDNNFEYGSIPTVGVDSREKTIKILDMRAKLRLLDTAGQERWGTIANWYYRVSHAFIIVYDITDRQSFDDLKHWIERMDVKAHELAIRFVVGTKNDLEQERKVKYTEGETFSHSMGYRFCEVSAKSGRNIKQIFNTVSLYVLQSNIVEQFEKREVQSVIKKIDAANTFNRSPKSTLSQYDGNVLPPLIGSDDESVASYNRQRNSCC
eukprot:413671_1